IVSDGHVVGDHTIDHKDLATLTVDQIQNELSGVQTLVQQVNPGYEITLARCPFGDPYNSLGTPATLAKVGQILQKKYIHVGWSIDSGDYNCPDEKCVVNNVMNQINGVDPTNPGKHWGIILMH